MYLATVSNAWNIFSRETHTHTCIYLCLCIRCINVEQKQIFPNVFTFLPVEQSTGHYSLSRVANENLFSTHSLYIMAYYSPATVSYDSGAEQFNKNNLLITTYVYKHK